METFGQRLRQFRLKKGFTQSQLAEGIITASMCSQMESDKARPSWHVLEQIAQKLEISVDELIGNSQMNLVLVSEYRLVKGMLSAGEYSGALPLLKNILESNNGKLDPFEIRYDYACCLLHLEQFGESEDLFHQLLEHTQTSGGNSVLTIRVLHQLGYLEMKRRRYQIAEHYLDQAIARLRASSVNNVHLQGSLLMTLGMIQQKFGKLQEAVSTYQLAVPMFEEREETEAMGSLYLKLAHATHMAKDYEQATDYAQRAKWCFETLNCKREKLELEVRLAVLEGETGDEEKAIRSLESIAEEYKRLGRQVDRGIVVTELAKLHLKRGLLDQAEEACRVARQLLPTVHPYQAWISRTQAGIANARNQHTVASKYLKQAADCFKLTDCQTEYEETMHELARCYESNADCQSALRVMQELWLGNRQARQARGIVL